MLNLFGLSIPFWIPAVIGLYLVANRRNELSLMAGLLTLKPILTTPLWLLIISSLQGAAGVHLFLPVLSILPGAGLTALAFVIFRSLFYGPRSTSAMLLIVLDCMRWINSGLLTATGSSYNVFSSSACFFAFVGLIFPTAYAVVALTTTMTTHEQERRPE
jgi:hypothetical protein